MSEQSEKAMDPQALALLEKLQQSYQDKGPTAKGRSAENYHKALAAYVQHLERNGGAPESLRKSLAWYDQERGAVELQDNGQLSLL